VGAVTIDQSEAAAVAAGCRPPAEKARTNLQAISALPTTLSPQELIGGIVAADRLLSYVQAAQAGLLAEFARPGRCGDLCGLVGALTQEFGRARNRDGTLNLDQLTLLVAQETQKLAAAEVGAALCISPLAAAGRVNTAVELVEQLPATHAALLDGRIDRYRATVIADQTAVLGGEDRRAVEQRVLPEALRRTPKKFQALVCRAVHAADPAAAGKRERKARKERCVTHRALPDGVGMLAAYLPAEDALSAYTLLDLIAAANKGLDDRGVDALRADALSDLVTRLLAGDSIDIRDILHQPAPAPPADNSTDAADHNNPASTDDGATTPIVTTDDEESPAPPTPGPAAAEATAAAHAADSTGTANPAGAVARQPMAAIPTRQGRPVHLNLTMSMSTFCGLDQLPAHLTGHGAMTADWARTITTAAATLTLLIIDPATGETIGITNRTYRPRQHLRDAVTTLHDTCAFIGCGQPSWRTDLDHITPYNHTDPAAGGHTSTTDLRPACRRHHLLKTHTDWTYHANPDRSLTFTSPTGHTYHAPPDTITLPGEWLTPTHDTPRTHLSPTNTEHASACADPAWQPQPLTIGDQIRAYLQQQKRQIQNNKTTPPPPHPNNDPPPF
jgi:Domain of unknown function (DUF222)